MNNQFLSKDVTNFLFCSDLMTIFVGEIKEKDYISEANEHNIFGELGILYNDDKEYGKTVSYEDMECIIYGHNLLFIVADLSNEKYIETAKKVCHIACKLSQLVIFCPIIHKKYDMAAR